MSPSEVDKEVGLLKAKLLRAQKLIREITFRFEGESGGGFPVDFSTYMNGVYANPIATREAWDDAR